MPQNLTDQLQVRYSMPESSPEIIEQQATARLENAFSQLNDVKSIQSKSTYNEGRINLIFNNGANIPMKKFELASLIRQIYPQLTQALSYPVIAPNVEQQETNPPLLIYTIIGDNTSFEVQRQSEMVFYKPLSFVSGVKQVEIVGSENKQISIRFDSKNLNSYNIDATQLSASIQRQFQSYYLGMGEYSTGSRMFVKLLAGFPTLSSLRNIPIIKSTLKMGDVAEVTLEEKMPSAYFRVNGQNAINLIIYAHEKGNSIEIADKVKQQISALSTGLPTGYKIRLDYDDTTFLKKELDKNYLRIGLSLLILLGFVFVAYRSWRYLAILLFSLLVNVALTMLLVWFFDVDVHLYTLGGVAISFGLIVDGAIVMVDYYHQYRNRRVFLALLSASLTTMAALFLVFLLPEEDRRNLSDFVSIVIIALGTSLLTSLIFIPSVYELVLGRHVHKRKINTPALSKVRQRATVRHIKYYYMVIGLFARYRKAFLFVLALFFGLPIFMLPPRLGDSSLYNGSIGSDFYQTKVKPVVDVVLGGSLRLFANDVYDRISYRELEKTRLFVVAEFPYGNTLQSINSVFSQIEYFLGTIDGIDRFVTQIKSGQYGTLEITFDKDAEKGPLPVQVKGKIMAISANWGGIDWDIYGVGEGFNNASADETPRFRVQMRGYNFDELEKQANEFANRLLKHKRVQKVNVNDRIQYDEKQSRQYVMELDEHKLFEMNTNSSQVINSLQAKSQPIRPQPLIWMDNATYPISILERGAEKFNVWDLMNSNLTIATDKTVKVNAAATLRMVKVSSAIYKENRLYLRNVSFDYAGNQHYGEKYLDEQLKEMSLTMPAGYTAKKQSFRWATDGKETDYRLLLILIVSIYVISAVLFENLKQPLMIVTVIPVSFIGVFLTFAVFDFYFDQGGYAAFIMLGGLAVSAAILIVSDFNAEYIKLRNYNKRLIRTVSNRSRTIVLTVISSCCSLIPFLVEGQNEVFWFSLAVGTIGGLIMSLFAIFVVLPVLMWKKPQLRVHSPLEA